MVDNSFGLPLGINLFNLSAYSQKTGIATDINFEPGVNPFIINAPDLSQPGQSVITEISVNKTNSNIDDVTNTTLSYIDYSARAITNPGGAAATQNNFVLDSSRASVDFEVVLPMDLRAEDFEVKDTVDFDLESLLMADTTYYGDSLTFPIMIREIKSAQIRMETENGMPVDVNMQVVLVDSLYNPLDSLFTEETKNVLPSAMVDANGKVISPTQNDLLIDYPPARLDKIRNTRYAMVRGTFETIDEGQTLVKFYSYYEINFKLGLKANAEIRYVTK